MRDGRPGVTAVFVNLRVAVLVAAGFSRPRHAFPTGGRCERYRNLQKWINAEPKREKSMTEVLLSCRVYGCFLALWRVCTVPFWQDRQGAVGITFALLAMVLIVVAGAAVDFGRGARRRPRGDLAH